MLSPAELSLYDRQIRLWGLGKQRLMRASVVGVFAPYSVLGAAQEMLKNIALKGVGKVILCSNDRVAGFEKDAVLFNSCDFIKEIHELNPAVEWEVVHNVNDCLDRKPNILCTFSSSCTQECFALNADCIARGIVFQLVVPINSSYCIMCSFRESLEDFCLSYKERFTNGAGGQKTLHGEFGKYLVNGFTSNGNGDGNSLKSSLFTTALNAIVGAVSAQEIFNSVTTVINDSDKKLDQRITKAYFICAESLESSIIS